MSARPSAQVIPLPGAASEPIHYAPRRGRYPANVTKIRRGYQLKRDSQWAVKKEKELQYALGAYSGDRDR